MPFVYVCIPNKWGLGVRISPRSVVLGEGAIMDVNLNLSKEFPLKIYTIVFLPWPTNTSVVVIVELHEKSI